MLSLAMVAAGVYRCSVELTPPAEPGVISVEPARVLVPAQALSEAPDSLSSGLTGLFTRRLGELTGAETIVGEDERAWAVVRLTLSGQVPAELELLGTAVSRAGAGLIASSTAEGRMSELPDMAESVAHAIAEELGILGNSLQGQAGDTTGGRGDRSDTSDDISAGPGDRAEQEEGR